MNGSGLENIPQGFEGVEKKLEVDFMPIGGFNSSSLFSLATSNESRVTSEATPSSMNEQAADEKKVSGPPATLLKTHSAHHGCGSFSQARHVCACGADTRGVGLRAVSAEKWGSFLKSVHCEIISSASNAHCDAFVLSESSLFVYPLKFVLKTCGTTTLLCCVDELLEIASQQSLKPEAVFFSRKNYVYPERQLGPHKSFRDEVAFLNARFPDGAGYVMGPQNADHWFLYVADCSLPSTKSESLRIAKPGARSSSAVSATSTSASSASSPPASSSVSADASDNDDSSADKSSDSDEDDKRRQARRKEQRLALTEKLGEVLIEECAEENVVIYHMENMDMRPQNTDDEEEASTAPVALSTVSPSPSVRQLLDSASHSPARASDQRTDVTLEIMMHELDPQIMKEFFYRRPGARSDGSAPSASVAERSGIAALVPGALIDEFLFDPCGYSMNGLYGPSYFTIHVTPEPECSFVSFETNLPAKCFVALVRAVVQVFQPGSFTVALFSDYGAAHGRSSLAIARPLQQYKLLSTAHHDFIDYNVTHVAYERQ